LYTRHSNHWQDKGSHPAPPFAVGGGSGKRILTFMPFIYATDFLTWGDTQTLPASGALCWSIYD
jgi:hypothetical protein